MKQMDKKECRNKVHCNVFAFCCSNKEESMHCWEMAEAQNDFHFQYNICSDCFVHLHINESSSLTRKDIEKIMSARASVGEGKQLNH